MRADSSFLYLIFSPHRGNVFTALHQQIIKQKMGQWWEEKKKFFISANIYLIW